MSIGGFFKAIGKGIGKGVAWTFRHPAILEGIIDAAQQRQLLNAKGAAQLGLQVTVTAIEEHKAKKEGDA